MSHIKFIILFITIISGVVTIEEKIEKQIKKDDILYETFIELKNEIMSLKNER